MLTNTIIVILNTDGFAEIGKTISSPLRGIPNDMCSMIGAHRLHSSANCLMMSSISHDGTGPRDPTLQDQVTRITQIRNFWGWSGVGWDKGMGGR